MLDGFLPPIVAVGAIRTDIAVADAHGRCSSHDLIRFQLFLSLPEIELIVRWR